MPFGLSGAPSSLQRLMDKVLRGLPFVIIYLDDILVHSIDSETHCTHLRTVFKRLSEAGLTIRGQKCHLGLRSVTYLGHTFSSSGMAPDPQKVQSIRQWPQPNTATEVRQFLGLASYYRRYILHFANIAAPLNELTCKQMLVPLGWEPFSSKMATSLPMPAEHSLHQNASTARFNENA